MDREVVAGKRSAKAAHSSWGPVPTRGAEFRSALFVNEFVEGIAGGEYGSPLGNPR
jgi:hypothetical protein